MNISNRLHKIILNLIALIAFCSILFSIGSNVLGIGNGQDDDIDQSMYTSSDSTSSTKTETEEPSEAPQNPSTETVDGNKEMKIYTIEDIFFNRIPLLDCNYFTDTAGGKNVEEGSAISVIRNIVKMWYYSFRNVSIVVIAILIIYCGIRIAVSTIAEDKSNAKNMLINWVKALAIVLTLHFVMYFVQTLNQSLLNVMSDSLSAKYGTQQDEDGNTLSNNGQLYNTIVKRAFDVRFSIGIPATILYLVLVVYFIKYFFVYVRRYATVLILTILAPLVAIKHALLSVNGKGSSEFKKWLSDYITAVFLQSIHALVYVTLIATSFDLALENVAGFLIAMVMLHGVSKITDLASQIFSFSGGKGGSGSIIGDILHPGADSPLMSGRMIFDIAAWKKFHGEFKGLKANAIRFKDGIKYSEPGQFVGKYAEKAGKAIKNTKLGKKATSAVSSVRETIDNIAKEADAETTEKLGNSQDPNSLENVNLSRKTLKKNRFRRGEQKRAAIQILKGIKKLNGGQKFKATTKLTVSILGTMASVPLAIASDSEYDDKNLGVLLGATSVGGIFSAASDLQDVKVDKKKNKKEKFDKVVGTVVVGNTIMDHIGNMYRDDFGDDDKDDAEEILNDMGDLKVNALQINEIIKDSVANHNYDVVDPRNVNTIVNDILKSSEINSVIKNEAERAQYAAIIESHILKHTEEINDMINEGKQHDDDYGVDGIKEYMQDTAEGSNRFTLDFNDQESQTQENQNGGTNESQGNSTQQSSSDDSHFASGVGSQTTNGRDSNNTNSRNTTNGANRTNSRSTSNSANSNDTMPRFTGHYDYANKPMASVSQELSDRLTVAIAYNARSRQKQTRRENARFARPVAARSNNKQASNRKFVDAAISFNGVKDVNSYASGQGVTPYNLGRFTKEQKKFY